LVSIGLVVSEEKIFEPEAVKSLYRSPGYKKNQLVLCKNYVISGSHLGIPINIKTTKIYYLDVWNVSDPIVEVNAVVRHFRQPWVLIRKIWQ
jgi:hypothetical protein